jgi:3-oxoacyl-[acyl-carrier-protein] synthase III
METPSQLRHSRMAGLGAYLPERIVTNDDLAGFLETNDEWIVQRTGIRQRHFAAPGEGSAAMGAEAARRAVADARWSLDDVEFIVFATVTPDHFFPGAGCYAQALLGLPGVGVMDVRNQCSGFLYALTAADALIAAGRYDRVLVVGAEKHSACLEDPAAPRHIAVLFGDGAAAVALEASDRPGCLGSVLHADGQGADALKLELFDFKNTPYIRPADLQNGRHLPVMDGRQVYTHAVERMTEACLETVARAGKTLADVDLVVPPQANLRITEALRKRLDLPPEKVFSNIETRGNTTAASIPLALADARDAGLLQRGSLVLLVAFGSGFTWGGVLWEY